MHHAIPELLLRALACWPCLGTQALACSPRWRSLTLRVSARHGVHGLQADKLWSSILVSRLNKDVKLVGASLSCHIHPHVQSGVVATDEIGLGVGWPSPF